MIPRFPALQLTVLSLFAGLGLGLTTARAVDVSVTLGWTAPDVLEGEPALTGYRVHYGTQPRELAPYDQQVAAFELETQVKVSNLVKGRIYYFAVTASNETGAVSEYSEEIAWSHGDLDTDGMQDEWEDSIFVQGAEAISGKDDEDQDGMSNAAEFTAGTDPLDAASKSEIIIAPWDGSPRLTYKVPALTGSGYDDFDRTVTLEQCAPPDYEWLPIREDLSAIGIGQIVDYQPASQTSPNQAVFYRLVSTLVPTTRAAARPPASPIKPGS